MMRSVESKSDADSNSLAEPELNRNPASRQPNIDLLLGVSLNLTLRFGRRVLALRDILELTSGRSSSWTKRFKNLPTSFWVTS